MALIIFRTVDAATMKPLGGVLGSSVGGPGPWQAMSNACGDMVTELQPAHYDITFTVAGYHPRVLPADLGDCGIVTVGLDRATPAWTDAELRKIQGAIWPTRAPVSFGPRSGQPDNIVDTGCEAYSAQDMTLARSAVSARRYTHVQMGPFVDPGYHGQYPAIDFRGDPDATLTQIEAWWSAGYAVVAFIGPDGWTTADMQTLEPIFSQPRWQAALKMIVPYGWEPSEDTSNAAFVERFQWAKRVFPNALQYIHLASEFDAPGNNDDFTPGQSKYIGHAAAWANVVPYLTGFLIQNGPYATAPAGDPTTAKNFGDQFRADARGSLRDRFTNGYAGWPTTSANGGPLDLINAECTSYNAYWHNLPEQASREWGQLAMANGADGFFDAGIV